MKERLYKWYNNIFRSRRNWEMEIKTNVQKQTNGLLIQLDAPGRTLTDFEVTFDHEQLDLQIRSISTETAEDVDYLRHEFYLKSFVKILYIGIDCDENDIKTTYEKGILTIYLQTGERTSSFY